MGLSMQLGSDLFCHFTRDPEALQSYLLHGMASWQLQEVRWSGVGLCIHNHFFNPIFCSILPNPRVFGDDDDDASLVGLS